jgi:hypothetical protein
MFNYIIKIDSLSALAYITSEEQSAYAVALVTAAVGINAATYLGFQINHIDLSPNHSGKNIINILIEYHLIKHNEK